MNILASQGINLIKKLDNNKVLVEHTFCLRQFECSYEDYKNYNVKCPNCSNSKYHFTN